MVANGSPPGKVWDLDQGRRVQMKKAKGGEQVLDHSVFAHPDT